MTHRVVVGAMALEDTFRVLNSMVGDGILRRYAVTGAVAALNYVEVTSTVDLDVLISIDDLTNPSTGLAAIAPLLDYLRARGYTEFRDEGILIEGWPVQFLPVADDLDAEGLAQAVAIEVDTESGSEPIRIAVLRPEHLVAKAVKIGRPKDRERIIRFLEENAVDLGRLRDVLTRHNLVKEWSRMAAKLDLPDLDDEQFEQK